MDFDDDHLQNQSKAPARPRFTPKNSRGAQKPNAVPVVSKLEEPAPKPEVEPPSISASTLFNEKAVEEDVKPSISGVPAPKSEPSALNGTVDMEVEVEYKLPEGKAEPMVEDSGVEDEVVREIDVYFNPTIGPNSELFVMQYPLRPWWRPYELDEQCDEVRVKPASKEVEVDLSLDVQSKNYDAEWNSRLTMTKQTLASYWKPPHATTYAVGILTGNKLHLNPAHAIVQLRPSMKHLRGKTEESGQIKVAESSNKQGKQLEPVTEEDTDKEEDWVPLEYHGAKSDLAGRYLETLMVHENSPIEFEMNPCDYLNSLCEGAGSRSSKPEGALKRSLLSIPLDERIKKLLCEAPQIHRYSALLHYAPDVPEELFLNVLHENGHLVQGCWVARSKLVFEKASYESLGRDCTLLLFSKKSVIYASNFPIKKTVADSVKKFLKIFAIERSTLADWKFKQPTDVSFLKKYPGIVKKQEKIWQELDKKLEALFPKSGEGDRTGKNDRPTNNTNVKKPSIASERQLATMGKAATKVGSGASTSRRTMSDETREALPKALQKIFQNHKVCSFELICQSLRDLAVSQSSLPKADPRMVRAAARGVDAPQAELVEVISQVATEIHGVFVAKSSPEHPEYDSLRKVVIDLLLAKMPNDPLKKAEIFEAAKIVLKRDISNTEYTKVISELCESKGASWFLKRSN